MDEVSGNGHMHNQLCLGISTVMGSGNFGHQKNIFCCNTINLIKVKMCELQFFAFTLSYLLTLRQWFQEHYNECVGAPATLMAPPNLYQRSDNPIEGITTYSVREHSYTLNHRSDIAKDNCIHI